MRLCSTTIALFILTGIACARDDAPLARGVIVHGTKTSYALPRGASSFVIRLTRSRGGRFGFCE